MKPEAESATVNVNSGVVSLVIVPSKGLATVIVGAAKSIVAVVEEIIVEESTASVQLEPQP